jgi:pilus assembly protein CpaF
VIDPLLKDPTISEIMINDLRTIYIEKAGKLALSGLSFPSLEDLNALVTRVLELTGKTLEKDQAYLDAMLPDGSRINLVMPPLTLYGPCLTIRKFPSRQITIHDLIEQKSLDQRMAYFLNICAMARINLLICGGTGSGKSTLLNIMATFIPKSERVVLIEDTPELSFSHPNSVRLQTRPQSPTTAAITIRDLVVNSLRMRPDRIIVGECRTQEAFDILQAMNTGHSGSMTSIHANTPRDGISRLETLCLLAGSDLPLPAIRKQIASAIDLLIQVKRFRDGKRRITAMSEITGSEGEMVTLQDIFTFETETESFKASGLVPTFADELRELGFDLPTRIFN